MATAGKPSITTPRALELRAFQSAIDNIRERIQGLDARIAALASQSSQASAIANLQAQIAALKAQLDALDVGSSELEDLLVQPDGLVTLREGALTTRVLQPGVGIEITNPDGHDGDPVIAAPLTDSVLYDSQGRAMLTGDGHVIFVT